MPQDDTSIVILAGAPLDLARVFVPPHGGYRPSNVEADTSFRYVLENGQRLQIVDYAEAGAAEVAIIPLDLDGFDRIEAVYRLLSSLHGRAIPPDTRLTRQQRLRLRKMLQAIDGYRDGATQQEIAQVLFDIDHLDRDEWQASSTRHSAKALLRDARAMIAGGYRKLLRHRRRK